MLRTKENKSLSLYSKYPYESPIKNTSISTEHTDVIVNVDSYETETACINFPHNVSDQSGLNYWKNNVVNFKDGRKFTPSINMKGGKVDIILKEDNINKDKFLPFCIVMYIRKFVFTNFPKSNEERKQHSAKISLIED